MHVAVLSLIRHDFARGLPLLFCRRLVAWFLCRVMRRCCWTFCLRYLQRIIIIIRGASVRVSNETNERRNFLEEEKKEREKIFFFFIFWWERFCLQGKFFNISFLWKKEKEKRGEWIHGSRFNFMVVIRIFPGGRGKRGRDFDARQRSSNVSSALDRHHGDVNSSQNSPNKSYLWVWKSWLTMKVYVLEISRLFY